MNVCVLAGRLRGTATFQRSQGHKDGRSSVATAKSTRLLEGWRKLANTRRRDA